MSFIERVTSKDAVIAIVGMGYVGVPLALRFVDAGFKVLGIDIDARKVDALKRGKSYIKHISEAEIAAALPRLDASSDFARVAEADAILICVPTPLNKNREPDLRYIVASMDGILPYLRAGQLISLESTTYPGTTEEIVRPRIEERGLIVGEDVYVVFSPEREDPGNLLFNTKTTPKVVGGDTPACLEAGLALYGMVIDAVVPVSSTRAAEMTKLLENIHRAVNIGLVNEMKIVASRMGIDIHEVIQAAATKPFGFTSFSPGPGLGGHCIPIDPFYLSWKAREYGLNTRFIELAGEVNSVMPEWVLGRVADALNEREKSLKGSRILVLGIAYKKNIDDARESPALRLIEGLRAKGALVDYSDPYIPRFDGNEEHPYQMVGVELTPAVVASYDCLLLATNHDAFDYVMIAKHARLIVDTRGTYRERAENVVSA